MTPEQKKIIRENVIADVITFKRDGTVVFKDSYFYRHGRNEDLLARNVTQKLISLGFRPTVLELHDAWAAWPRTSYFVAVFKIEHK